MCVPSKKVVHALAQSKMLMEFALKHYDLAILSADDMKNVNIGMPAASRYHQFCCLFMADDSPNLPDHEYLVTTKDKIVPSGLMFLNNQKCNQRRSVSADNNKALFTESLRPEIKEHLATLRQAGTPSLPLQ